MEKTTIQFSQNARHSFERFQNSNSFLKGEFMRLKLTKIYPLLFLLWIFTGCAGKEKVFIGKWELEQVKEGNQTINVKEFSSDSEWSDSQYYLNFYENGRIEGYILGRQLTGTWKYQAKTKTIIVEDEEDTPPYTLNIREISTEKMLVSGRENDRSVILVFYPKKSKTKI